MATTVWKGPLTFGLISIPVRMFAAARGERVSFNQLHKVCHSRIKQPTFCPVCNRNVERSEIVKGYEYEKDQYVEIDDEDIKKVAPKTAKVMEILEFVKTSEVDPVYFESSYYMMPEEAGRRPYALLTKALEESEYVAIAKITMHNREYTVFLRPHEGGMMLHTMYYAEEVRKVEGFGAPDVELKDAEVKVAHQLIEALADKWDPDKYKDTFQENLKKLIEIKLEGGEVAAVEKPKKLAPVVDLMQDAEAGLLAVEGMGMPAKPEHRRPLRLWIEVGMRLLVFGGFIGPPSGESRHGWRARIRDAAGLETGDQPRAFAGRTAGECAGLSGFLKRRDRPAGRDRFGGA